MRWHAVFGRHGNADAGAHDRLVLLDVEWSFECADDASRGHGYVIPFGQGPTAYYPVGYPIVLAVVNFFLIHTVGDHPIGAAAAVNVVGGVAAVALVFAIGRRLASDAVGLVAAAITALYPNLVYHTAVALTLFIPNGVV